MSKNKTYIASRANKIPTNAICSMSLKNSRKHSAWFQLSFHRHFHRIRMPSEEITFTAWPKIKSQSKILGKATAYFVCLIGPNFRFLWFTPSLGVHSPSSLPLHSGFPLVLWQQRPTFLECFWDALVSFPSPCSKNYRTWAPSEVTEVVKVKPKMTKIINEK